MQGSIKAIDLTKMDGVYFESFSRNIIVFSDNDDVLSNFHFIYDVESTK